MEDTLEFRGVSKYFPGVKAIDDISFEVYGGEVHALIGENGAGKSTLMKVMGGIHTPTKGSFYINKEEKKFINPFSAINNGIAIIHQELQLIENMSVAENIFLGRFKTKFNNIIDWKLMNDEAKKVLTYLEQDIEPTTKISELSIGQKQMVEIAKSISLNASVIAFDEPTSSLSEAETVTLFKVIEELKKQNKIILYISHRMSEIFEVCNSCTILKDGKWVKTYHSLKDLTKEKLISKMTGREIGDIFSFVSNKSEVKSLEVNNIVGRDVKTPTSFYANKGEILGFFGLVGSGRSELLKTIYGHTDRTNGSIKIEGEYLQKNSIFKSIKNGLFFLSESRKEDGIITSRSILENITISCKRNFLKLGVILNNKKEKNISNKQVKDLNIKIVDLDQKIENLSGGNQQKVLLGRWLSEEKMKILMVDEPTKGIDVSSKNEIYQIFYKLASLGVCIIVVSSELPEVMGVTDRIYVMREGEISSEFTRDEYNETSILKNAFPHV